MRNTSNILSFDDARTSRASASKSRHAADAPRGFSHHRRSAAYNDPKRAKDEAWEEARFTARQAHRGEQRKEGGSKGESRPGFFSALSDRVREGNRARAKARADKAFDKLFPGKQVDDAAGPRAALYKGKMGSSQKRAQRLQRGGAGAADGASSRRMPNATGILSSIATSRKAVVGLAVAACFAITCFSLYGPAQTYYHAVRQHDQQQAELAAVEARNAELQSTVDYLQTEAGIEQSARDELGWVRDGENSVYVQGLDVDDEDSGTASTAGSIVPGSVDAPETWYSPILDVIFGAK